MAACLEKTIRMSNPLISLIFFSQLEFFFFFKSSLDLILLFFQSAVNCPKDDSVSQRKVEATSENDAASNHSNGYVACVQRYDENIDKASDSQVSVSI